MIYIPSIRIGGNPCGNDCNDGPCNDAIDPCEGGKVWGDYADPSPPFEPASPVFDQTTGQLLCGPAPTDLGGIPDPYFGFLLGPTFTQVGIDWVVDIYYPPANWALVGGEISNWIPGLENYVLHANYITANSGSASISRAQPINLDANNSRILRFEVIIVGPPCVMYDEDWSITISCPIDYSVTFSGKLLGTTNTIDPSSCVPTSMLSAILYCKCPFDPPTGSPALGGHYDLQGYSGYGNPSFSNFGSFDISWTGITGLGSTDAELLVLGPSLWGYAP